MFVIAKTCPLNALVLSPIFSNIFRLMCRGVEMTEAEGLSFLLCLYQSVVSFCFEDQYLWILLSLIRLLLCYSPTNIRTLINLLSMFVESMSSAYVYFYNYFPFLPRSLNPTPWCPFPRSFGIGALATTILLRKHKNLNLINKYITPSHISTTINSNTRVSIPKSY